MSRGILIAALLCAGCYDPPTGACGIHCDTECPGDLVCSPEHVCVAADGTGCDAPEIGFTSVTLGGRHGCGLDTAGTAYCWGDNRLGQIGVNTTMPLYPRPTKLDGTWTAIAAGGTHTCGIRESDASVLCWGDNIDGQVRGNDGGSFPTPTAIEFGIAAHGRFDAIATGGAHSCGISEGKLWCWGRTEFIGSNGNGQAIALQIGTLTDWTAVSLGADYGCGVSTSMGVLCWGTNDDGQAGAGAGASANIPTPTQLPGVPAGKVLKLSAGSDTACAVIAAAGGTSGTLSCWGDGGPIDDRYGTPEPVTPMGTDTAWTDVEVGDTTICGLLRGHAFCWGDASGVGLIGAGLWAEKRPLDQAVDLGPADSVSFSTRPAVGFVDRFGCLRNGTQLACWGENTYGELGLGGAAWFPSPVEVAAPMGTWTAVKSGERQTCATTDAGGFYCWGDNNQGAVIPSPARGVDVPCVPDQACDYVRPEPAPVMGIDGFTTGYDNTCTRKGVTINCWGRNIEGALGMTTSGHGVTTPSTPESMYVGLSGGNAANCGHLANGKIACWGEIAGVTRQTPTLQINAELLMNVTQVEFGDRWACAARSDGFRVCWGDNGAGQLGNGTTTPNATPVATATPGVLSISARGAHACAITAAHTVACWGQNDRGQSGVTGGQNVLMPTNVMDATADLQDCHQVAVSYRHACAICGGRPYCWGENQLAQLGRGIDVVNDTRRGAPPLVPMNLTYTQVSTFEGGGCALTDEGKLFCWGDSMHGEVGTGTSARNLPTPVVGAF